MYKVMFLKSNVFLWHSNAITNAWMWFLEYYWDKATLEYVHYNMYWLAVYRQHAITWPRDLWRHMESLNHSKLKTDVQYALHLLSYFKPYIAVLVLNYGISNTIVLEIP